VDRVGPVKGLRIAVAAFVLSVVLFIAVVGVALYLPSANQSDTCHAIKTNNQILRDLLAHVEQRSLQSIREGVTKDLTPAQVRAFYDPTLKRIDSVSC
jgi:PhoPQ-activated pathogenicity-related protein